VVYVPVRHEVKGQTRASAARRTLEDPSAVIEVRAALPLGDAAGGLPEIRLATPEAAVNLISIETLETPL